MKGGNMFTKGKWKFEKSDLTIRSDDFQNGSQMGDYKGVIIADLKPALGCDYSDNVDLEHTGRTWAVPQTLANANLIAAAPDMYQALWDIVHAEDIGMGRKAKKLRIDIARDILRTVQV